MSILEDTGVPPRYILFASDYNWLTTESERVSNFNTIDEAVSAADKLKKHYSLIIDHQDPRFPLYLNPDNNYKPFEIY